MNPSSVINKAFLLHRFPLFSSLDMEHLLLVAEKLEWLVLKKNETIFFLNDRSFRLYLIVDGKVNIVLPDRQFVIQQGDFFGEEGLFSAEKRKYSAKAKTELTLLALAKNHLFALLQEYPEVAINLLKILTTHLPWRPREINEG